MAVRVEESIEIRRTPEEVWAFVEEHENDGKWCRKVKSVVRVSPEHWNVMHKPVPLRPAIPLALERLTADPPSRLTMREDDEAATLNVEYRLEPTLDGTRFTQVSEFEWKKLPTLLHKTFAHGVRRDIRAQLRSLKRILEA